MRIMIKPSIRAEPVRRSIYLKTKDLNTAARRRDRIIDAIANAGVLGEVRNYPARPKQSKRVDESAESGKMTA